MQLVSKNWSKPLSLELANHHHRLLSFKEPLSLLLVNKDGMISSQVAYAISFKELVKTTVTTACLQGYNGMISSQVALFQRTTVITAVNKDGMIASQVAYAISLKELVKTTFLQPWYDFIT